MLLYISLVVVSVVAIIAAYYLIVEIARNYLEECPFMLAYVALSLGVIYCGLIVVDYAWSITPFAS